MQKANEGLKVFMKNKKIDKEGHFQRKAANIINLLAQFKDQAMLFYGTRNQMLIAAKPLS